MGSDKKSIIDDYRSSLADLTFNSKPLINVLTMLAEENSQHADDIVQLVVKQIEKAPPQSKMPVLYLMDSILKNVGGAYRNVIGQYIVEGFVNVFEKGDEKVRLSLFKLRNTWSACFKPNLLHLLDVTVNEIDRNWPIIPISKYKTNEAESSSGTQQNKSSVVDSKGQRNDSAELLRQKLLQEKVEKATKLREQKLLEEKERVERLLAIQEKKKAARKAEEERSKHEFQLRIEQQKRDRLIEDQRKEIENLRNAKDELLRVNAQQHVQIPSKVPLDSSSNNRYPSVERGDQQATYQNDNSNWERVRGDRNAPGPSFSRNRENARGRRASKRQRLDGNEASADRPKFSRGGGNGNFKSNRRGKMTNRSFPKSDDQVGRHDRSKGRRLSTQERRKIIPRENEMPRSMRMDQHTELMMQLERRLSSGQLSKREHSELVDQLQMLYDIQQKKNTTEDERQWRDPRGRDPSLGNEHQRRSSWFDERQRHNAQNGNWVNEKPEQQQHSLPLHQTQYEGAYPSVHNPQREGNNRWWPEDATPAVRDANAPANWNESEQHASVHQNVGLPPPDSNSRDLTSHVTNKASAGEGMPSSSTGDFVGVADLFNRLLHSGIISLPSTSANEDDSSHQKEQALPPLSADTLAQNELPDVEWSTVSLKSSSYPNIINQLCEGVQCSSCGLRFAEELKDEYSDHLDWHFQINRRETDSRRATSRQWFLSASDWLMSDALTVDGGDDGSAANVLFQFGNEGGAADADRDGSQTTCAVDLDIVDDDICDVCTEQFEQYWDEPMEEWRYREAIRAADGRTYHEQCYRDTADDMAAEENEQEIVIDNAITDIVNTTNQNEYLNVVKMEPESVII